jgi:hypothetical protein
LVSPRASEPLAEVRSELEALPGGSPALVLAPTRKASDQSVWVVAAKGGANFADQRSIFNGLIGLLSTSQAVDQQALVSYRSEFAGSCIACDFPSEGRGSVSNPHLMRIPLETR